MESGRKACAGLSPRTGLGQYRVHDGQQVRARKLALQRLQRVLACWIVDVQAYAPQHDCLNHGGEALLWHQRSGGFAAWRDPEQVLNCRAANAVVKRVSAIDTPRESISYPPGRSLDAADEETHP